MIKELDNIFEPNGLLATNLKDYVYRKTQHELAKVILDGMINNSNIVAEAPTGCGKSFGYLVPSILLTKERKSKGIDDKISVVVCTANKTLQRQLVEKDLPFLQKYLKEDFTYALMKGRNNFVCNKKMEENINEELLSGICKYSYKYEKDFWKRFKEWYFETKNGDLSSIDFKKIKNVIDDNTITENDCEGASCPRHSECYSNNARKVANEADIVVVNYHLLLSHFLIQSLSSSRILRDFDNLVLDEAHKLVDISRDFFGFNVGRFTLSKSISNFSKLMTELKDNENVSNIIKEVFPEKLFTHSNVLIKNLLEDLQMELHMFCKYLYSYKRSNKYNNLLQYDPDFTKFQNLIKCLKKFGEINNKLYGFFIDKNDENIDEDDQFSMALKFNRIYVKVNEFILNLQDNIYKNIIFNEEWYNQNFCAQIIDYKGESESHIKCLPVFIDKYLKEIVFSKVKNCSCVSATLATNNNFSFFKKSAGLQASEHIYKSEFDLKNQMIVYIDSRCPEQPEIGNATLHKQYTKTVSDMIANVIKQRDGSGLILTTSVLMVNELHKLLSSSVPEYKFFNQYDSMDSYKIIEKFKKDKKSCLIGTSSFWEGLDCPGDTLQTVIITKLPFKSKDDPLLNFLQYVKDCNWFYDYSLPLTILTFKQGIGRLIRKETDSGVIYIMDKRLITKGYGNQFLNFFDQYGIPVQIIS